MKFQLVLVVQISLGILNYIQLLSIEGNLIHFPLHCSSSRFLWIPKIVEAFSNLYIVSAFILRDGGSTTGLVRVWNNPCGDSGDSHGRYEPYDEADGGDWQVGDFVCFNDEGINSVHLTY